MNDGIGEVVKTKVWFNFFTQTLADGGLISKEKQVELQKRISLLNEDKVHELKRAVG